MEDMDKHVVLNELRKRMGPVKYDEMVSMIGGEDALWQQMKAYTAPPKEPFITKAKVGRVIGTIISLLIIMILILVFNGLYEGTHSIIAKIFFGLCIVGLWFAWWSRF